MGGRGFGATGTWRHGTSAVGRWLRMFGAPIGLLAVGVVAILAGSDEWGISWLGLDGAWHALTAVRLGVVFVIVGLLWAIAKGFSLVTLRVATVLALLVGALMITWIGRDSIEEAELANYEAAKKELDIAVQQSRREHAETAAAAAAPAPESDAENDDAARIELSFPGLGPEEIAAVLRAIEATGGTESAGSGGESPDGMDDDGEPAAGPSSSETVEANAAIAAEARDRAVAECQAAAVAASASTQASARAITVVGPFGPWTGPAAVSARVGVDQSFEQAESAEAAAVEARSAADAARAASRAAAVAVGLAIAATDDSPSTACEPPTADVAVAGIGETEAVVLRIEADAAAAEVAADAAAGYSQAAASAAELAFTELAASHGCGGLLDDESTLIGFDEAVRCGDLISKGCAEHAGDGEPCDPRTALRLLYSGYLLELTGTPRPADADAAKAFDETIRGAQERLQLLREPVPVDDLITSGADDLVTEALKPVTNNDIPSGLAGLGWVLIALLFIVLYRSLEVTNGRRRAGPALVSATSDDSKHAAEQFRVFLGRVNLAEPAPVPGGEVAASAADAFKGESISNKAVQFVAAVFQSTAFPKQGVEIQVTCREIPRPKGHIVAAGGGESAAADDRADAKPDADLKSTEVLVRGHERRTGRLLFAQDFVDDLYIRAISKSAYFAAGHVLSSGYTTPGWLRWRTRGHEGLRSYHRATFDTWISESKRRLLFEDAVARNPSTGVALVALANNLALEGDLVGSAKYALFARQRHDRFWTARYRLGVTLSMIAADMERSWNQHPGHQELAGLLRELNPKRFPLTDGVTSADDCVDDQGLLLNLAHHELTDAIRQLSWWRTILAARRQREREYWLRELRSGRRRAAIEAARSARLLVELRAARYDAERLGPAPGQASGLRRWIRCVWSTDPKPVIDISRDLRDWRCLWDRSVFDSDGGVDEWMVGRVEQTLNRVRHDDATVLYNAACFFDDAGEPAAAARLLQASRFARGGGAITLEWAERDPDLATLRASGWWPEVRAALVSVKKIDSRTRESTSGKEDTDGD